MCILTFLLRKPKAIISILNVLKLGEKKSQSIFCGYHFYTKDNKKNNYEVIECLENFCLKM